MNSRWVFGVALTVAACIGGAALYAQAVLGTINGYITDSSNAPAGKRFGQRSKRIRTPISTNPEGFYNATNLQPGEYSVTAEQAWFSKITREHVKVEVDATVRVDLKL